MTLAGIRACEEDPGRQAGPDPQGLPPDPDRVIGTGELRLHYGRHASA